MLKYIKVNTNLNEIYSYSYGAVYVFTSGGKKVCQLPARTKPTDSGRGGGSIIHTAAGLTFIPPQKDTERYISSVDHEAWLIVSQHMVMPVLQRLSQKILSLMVDFWFLSTEML